MTPLEIVQLLRLAMSAATSIGLDIVRIKAMIDENGGELSDADLDTLLAEAQEAIDEM